MMRSTQQHQTEFNKSTNLFICSHCTLPKKPLLYANTYMKIHCKNINTSHLIDLSGAQSQATTRCCLDPTHHLCRIPPSLHRAISMLYICVVATTAEKSIDFHPFSLSLSSRCHAVAYFWFGEIGSGLVKGSAKKIKF